MSNRVYIETITVIDHTDTKEYAIRITDDYNTEYVKTKSLITDHKEAMSILNSSSNANIKDFLNYIKDLKNSYYFNDKYIEIIDESIKD